MKTSTYISVTSDDRPVGRMGGINGTIPVLHLDAEYGRTTLQFDSDRVDETVQYLNQLVAEAGKLAQTLTQAAYSKHLAELEKADAAERVAAKGCPVCGSTDPEVFKLQPQGPPCTDAEGWHFNSAKAEVSA